MTEDIIFNLIKLGLLDDDITRRNVDKMFPLGSPCPTCTDRGKYLLNGEGVECDCRVQKILSRNYYAAGIPSQYYPLTLDDFTSEDRDDIVPNVQGYLDNFENNLYLGYGITFNGPVGTGKTFVMCHILKELLKDGFNVFFISFDELIQAVGNEWKDDAAKWYVDRMKTTKVLGIDELKIDSRNTNGFLSQAAENIIRFRTSNNLPTLLTTNLTSNEEKSNFAKMYSLLSEKNIRLETNGADVRGKEIRERKLRMLIENERRPIC